MKLNVSYVRPCGESGKLTARLDFRGKFDLESLCREFGGVHSKELGTVKLSMDGREILIFDNHVDIKNAEKEHEILAAIGKLKRFFAEAPGSA